MSILIKMIENEEGLYEGNLKEYFRVIFSAPNVSHPYHNFRHMLTVTCTVYEACQFLNYSTRYGKENMGILLIAGLFHDFGHKGYIAKENGEPEDDSENIQIALDAIRQHILPKDKRLLPEIGKLIRLTQFPHTESNPSLAGKILRDADKSQVLSDAWMQQIVFGLAQESRISTLQMLRSQVEYLSSLQFESGYGDQILKRRIQPKLEEVRKLISYVR